MVEKRKTKNKVIEKVKKKRKPSKKDYNKWQNHKNSKFDENTVRKIINFVKYDGTERDACEYANVPRTTYQYWKSKKYKVLYQYVEEMPDGTKRYIKNNYTIQQLIDRVRHEMRLLAKSTLHYNMKEKKSVQASIEFLKRRDPKYRDKLDVAWSWNINVTFGMPPSPHIKPNQSPADDE